MVFRKFVEISTSRKPPARIRTPDQNLSNQFSLSARENLNWPAHSTLHVKPQKPLDFEKAMFWHFSANAKISIFRKCNIFRKYNNSSSE